MQRPNFPCHLISGYSDFFSHYAVLFLLSDKIIFRTFRTQSRTFIRDGFLRVDCSTSRFSSTIRAFWLLY